MPHPKILCVSANPGMDRRLHVASLAAGAVNRARSAQGFAGGKAAHVAMAARALAGSAVWVGFLGGAIGQECARQLESLDIQVVSVPTSVSTRVNFEIIEDSGKITEILEPGGVPATDERQQFLGAFTQAIQRAGKDALAVISGSLPLGVGPDFYLSLIGRARAAGVRVFVDTNGEALRASASARPDFVKANREEAEELVGRPLKTIQAAAAAAREIVQSGPGSSAITLGDEGLVWVEAKNGPLWIARPPRLDFVSTVGCGDATLAGFAHAAAQGAVGKEAIRLAAACGAANCSAAAPGRIEFATVQSLLPRIDVERLST